MMDLNGEMKFLDDRGFITCNNKPYGAQPIALFRVFPMVQILTDRYGMIATQATLISLT